MVSTKNFFLNKKNWSVIKDEVIGYYLVPYIAKVLRTYKPLVIVDCFAGKGKFDDGNIGSPLIISNTIKAALERTSIGKSSIKAIFIEKKYSKDLNLNVKGYDYCEVWPGTFEQHLPRLLSLNSNCNLFVYIDPYGIKSLDFSRFKEIKRKNFNTLEILLNFNSFGFLREGCRLLKYEGLFTDDDSEYNYEIDDVNSIENMNHIANGDYWQGILHEYQQGCISMYEAEELFTNKYLDKLNELFCYVINIPIKVKTENIPKYRLVFATNSQDGLILMADNMNRKWKKFIDDQRGGQIVLFEYDFPDLTVHKGFDLEKDILELVKKPVQLEDLIVKLIQKYGISFSESEYKNKIKAMNGTEIVLDWYPTYTPTGKKATSLDYKKYKITVRAK